MKSLDQNENMNGASEHKYTWWRKTVQVIVLYKKNNSLSVYKNVWMKESFQMFYQHLIFPRLVFICWCKL